MITEQELIFKEAFNEEKIKKLLIDRFLPENFTPSEKELDISDLKFEKIKKVKYIGQSREEGEIPEIHFLIIEHTGTNDPRVTITRETFKIVKNFRFKNTIAVYFTKDSPNYRISLITMDIVQKSETKVKEELSNPKRYSYFLGPDSKVHTPTKNLILKGRIQSEKDLRDRFNIKVVTEEFYQELANWYFWALKHVKFPQDAEKETNGRNIALIRFITRMIFIWFMNKKGLIPDNLFDKNSLTHILKSLKDDETTYYTAILQNLFFATLNTKIEERKFRKDERYKGIADDYMDHRYYRHQALFKEPDKMKEIFSNIPFLNGGLFECLDKKKKDEDNDTGKEIRIDGFSDVKSKQPVFPNFLFFSEEETADLSSDYNDKKYKKTKVRGLINILKTYNFTVDESSPVDIEVSLDPELLGRVFENLLASYNPETSSTARKSTGSYYTPREIVDYMVEESLKQYFKTNLENEIKGLDEKINKLFSYDEEENPFTESETDKIISLINNIKVLDPAVGSGAFPMGMLQKLVFILAKLDPHNKRWKEEQIKIIEKITDTKVRQESLNKIEEYFSKNELNYGRKLYLIQNCLYGVDIQPIAIQIAKLRFFLSLLVDEKVNKNDIENNFGIEPLPNLETKLISANTLISLDKDQTLMPMPEIEELEKKLFEIRNKYFSEPDKKKKDKLRREDRKIRLSLKETATKLGSYYKHINQIVDWDPYNSNKSANWFDSEWMFGVKNGFDIVIGNPPYGNLIKEKSYKDKIEKDYIYSTSSEISSPFIEKGINLLKDKGILTYIITFAVTFSKDFSGNRKQIYDSFKETYIYTFDRDKCRIFESMTQSVSIIKCFVKNSSEKKGIFTSKFFRDTPDIYSISVINTDKYLLPKGSDYSQKHRLAKIGDIYSENILKKLLSFKGKVLDIILDKGQKIWIRTSGNYWYNAFDRKPYKGFAISSLYLDEYFANFFILLVNSSLFYFWFRIYGDGHNMNMDILEEFPLPSREDILKHSILLNKMKERFMNKLFSVFDKDRNRFLTSEIKDEIDLIDLILCSKFYGLDYDEYLYVTNYDSEIRGGLKLEINKENYRDEKMISNKVIV